MFELKYRIIDDIDFLETITAAEFDRYGEHISGYFQVIFDGHKAGGYYHDNALFEGETGDENIDYWFLSLLETINLLEETTGYVAFREIEIMDRWIEFKRTEDKVVINVACEKGTVIHDLLISKPTNLFSYITPVNSICGWRELKKEVILKSKQFIVELEKLNPELGKTCEVYEMKKMLNAMENHLKR